MTINKCVKKREMQTNRAEQLNNLFRNEKNWAADFRHILKEENNLDFTTETTNF